MARTESRWKTGVGGGYIQTVSASGYDVLINGTSKYLNFNTLSGESGYGFRDNSGTMQFKNSGGSWQNIGTGGSGGIPGGSNPQLQYNNAGSFGGITGATTDGTNLLLGNTALRIADTNASHYLIVSAGSDLTVNRTLTITTGDANRTLTLGANINFPDTSSLGEAIFGYNSGTGNNVWMSAGVGIVMTATEIQTEQDIGPNAEVQFSNLVLSGLTGSSDSLAYFNSLNSLDSLDTTTYPNLTEVSYLKGVTSAIQTQIDALSSAVVLKGLWDASAGTFPGSGSAQAGWSYIVSVAGTVDGVSFAINDRIVAITDNASTTTYTSNWFKLDYTDNVLSVFGRTGAVTATDGDYSQSLITGLKTTDSPTFAGLALGSGSLTLTGSIGSTGSRVTKGWFTDLEVTNAITGSITGNAGTVTNGVYTTGADSVYLTPSTAASTYQPLDADLTTIAGLTATTDNFIVSVASAWASRTPAQVRTTLGLVIGTNVQAYDADLTTWAGITPGTGVGTALAVNVGTAGAFVVNGGVLGTPSSGTLTNATGLPIAGLVSSTSTALGVGTLELGHASDTTLSRASAGVLAVEGVAVLTVAGGTLTGNINLGEGADPADKGIVIDSSLSADERYSGITIPGTAGATLAFGDLCYLDVTAGEWLLADADAASTAGSVILGICVDASTDGNATSMLVYGTVRSAAFPASIALGAPVYVSTTAGDITATAPSATDDVVRVVGWAVTTEPNTILFNPESGWITHT